MEDKETLKRINEVISKYLKIPVDKLKDDISYEEESAWDSVAHLKMISELESLFKIKFEIDEIVSLENVGKIKKLVLKKLI